MPEVFDAETLALARQLCQAALGCPEELITPEARLEEDLGADSFGRASLAALMEDQWDLTIPDREFLAMKTLGRCWATAWPTGENPPPPPQANKKEYFAHGMD